MFQLRSVIIYLSCTNVPQIEHLFLNADNEVSTCWTCYRILSWGYDN